MFDVNNNQKAEWFSGTKNPEEIPPGSFAFILLPFGLSV